MKNMVVCVMIALTAVCASDPAKRAEVATTESARLAPPSRSLSAFNSFQLEAMALSAEVRQDPKKVEVAQQLEEKLRAKVLPLLEGWGSRADRSGGTKTLVIRPTLVSLRVVSGGARFWAGAFVGDSSVDLDLEIVDGEASSVLARPRISRSASAMGGAWSVGATDKNLLDYIVDISHQYLSDSYQQKRARA